eukprot:scaffold122044_cov37-Attheya_sp.AAC.1
MEFFLDFKGLRAAVGIISGKSTSLSAGGGVSGGGGSGSHCQSIVIGKRLCIGCWIIHGWVLGSHLNHIMTLLLRSSGCFREWGSVKLSTCIFLSALSSSSSLHSTSSFSSVTIVRGFSRRHGYIAIRIK